MASRGLGNRRSIRIWIQFTVALKENILENRPEYVYKRRCAVGAWRKNLLRIGNRYVAEMIAHSLKEDPDECCGILAGKDETVSQSYRITNTAASPYRYLMDPQEFLNADRDSETNGWEFLAFYHSHTHRAAYPSQTDVRMALESGWLDILYALVSLQDKENPQVRLFHIMESGDIVEEDFEVT
jgi:proteasome lid subunit RPN8/RPN11